jgi:hypothetical protein
VIFRLRGLRSKGWLDLVLAGVDALT